ncbi:MAG TPA: DUF4388 domain-containing protein [Candidatus Eisenbacteria bacterium]|nr:DUF4388 domain-containing protein [Candidatus Eisenbacteria bacterium]
MSALAGDLAVFQPAEVFQLLQLAAASGRLTLEREGERAEIWFEHGRLTGARSSRGGVRTGELLVHMGCASRELVEGALADQAGNPAPPRIGALLVARGVPAPHVTRAVQDQLRRVLYGVLLWPAGRFRFDAGERVAGDAATEGLDLDRIILEALRLADQSQGR